jgi:hypothetical protein
VRVSVREYMTVQECLTIYSALYILSSKSPIVLLLSLSRCIALYVALAL